MKQVVGVTVPSALTELKRQLLIVDQIALLYDVKRDWDFRAENPGLAADLDWLTDRGAVFRTDFSLNLQTGVDDVRLEGGKAIIIPSDKPGILKFQKENASAATSEGRSLTVEILRQIIEDFCCRNECQILQNSKDMETISLFPPSVTRLSGSINTTPTTVTNVVIRALPEPDDSTPLEQILEFKKDEAAKSKLLELRRWISKLTKESVSINEAAQELEWLLQQYERHMRLHHLKINRGTLETFVTMTGEIAENLIKLKLGNLAKLPFLVTERKIALLEAELNAPGKEIAYIHAARKYFGGTPV